jgi:hypothetical protein
VLRKELKLNNLKKKELQDNPENQESQDNKDNQGKHQRETKERRETEKANDGLKDKYISNVSKYKIKYG